MLDFWAILPRFFRSWLIFYTIFARVIGCFRVVCIDPSIIFCNNVFYDRLMVRFSQILTRHTFQRDRNLRRFRPKISLKILVNAPFQMPTASYLVANRWFLGTKIFDLFDWTFIGRWSFETIFVFNSFLAFFLELFIPLVNISCRQSLLIKGSLGHSKALLYKKFHFTNKM